MSQKSTMPAAITITMVIACVAAWWAYSHSAVSAASPTELDRAVPVKAPLWVVPEHTSNTDSVVAPVSQVRAAMPVNDGSDAKRTGAADYINRPGATGAFVMSGSILAACNDPGIKGAHICDRLYADLAQIAKEPRDNTWSNDMEEKLQAYVEQTFKDASIRNIDCRTSLCAMEVQTDDPTITAVFHPYPNPLMKQLDRDTWMESAVGIAPESFVVMYKRR